ncbi:hypothetical protein OsI_33921 [Oryza sativa Indica Group]|uniref:Uncharacterized protein n=1 Tax=Oryza sativa subsp. indica TaxID=39946 RepID=B8BHB7_ORYSI|nr:hypothetical protein OsI_33921 [Oryza sativa Indica Group]
MAGGPCLVVPGPGRAGWAFWPSILGRGKFPREEARRNEDATEGAARGTTRRRWHGFLLRPPPSLRLHVHPLELEKTNLLLPGTLYPLQEIAREPTIVGEEIFWGAK